MLPSFEIKFEKPLCPERPMSVESIARRYGIPERSVRYAAERGHLIGFRDASTPGHKCWRFWRTEVERWLRRRELCN